MSSTLMSFSILLDNPSPVVDFVRSSLEVREGLWFTCLLIASAGVAIGCVLEIPETWSDLKEWKNLKKDPATPNPGWRVPMAAVGLLLVVLGVVGEGVFEGLVSINETKLRAHDEQVLGDTIKQAGAAKDSADAASIDAAKAKEASDKAVDSSSTALNTATGAHKEAGSFKKEIADAKQQAADAVSRLAEAEQRLADSTQREANAEARLSAIKTPRSLIHTDELIAKLKPFKGTKFVLNVFMDDESSRFTRSIAAALREAGWIRSQPKQMMLGIPTLSIQFDGQADRESVPSCIDTGISIHVSEKESLEVLRSQPYTSLPKMLQAAVALNANIGASISPPDEKNVNIGVLDPKPGEEKPMIICVGKKP